MTKLDVPTYLLTFTTYGTWLPGDSRGSVDRIYNQPGMPLRPGNLDLARHCAGRMAQPAFQFDANGRSAVDAAIREVCDYRQWYLHALNIRTCHLHVVASGEAEGKRMMNDFKAYGTRRLVRDGLIAAGRRVWTEGGSVRSVGTVESLERVLSYVMEGQGDPLPGAQPVTAQGTRRPAR